MMRNAVHAVCVVSVVVCLVGIARAEDPYPIEWIAQIGTSDTEWSRSGTVDASGNAYISGWTGGDLSGPSAGSDDAFLSKFDSDGNELWTTQIGTDFSEHSYGIAVDALGNAYITGYTTGHLAGLNPTPSQGDVFLSKFDSAGNNIWNAQIGTRSIDQGYGVAVDTSGNAYVSGFTGGYLGGSHPGANGAFLSKFDSDGNEIWTTQIGTRGDDKSFSVAVDASSNAYVTGHTLGSLGGPNAGGMDSFLSKFDSSGNEVWTTQIGTDRWDYGQSVALDASGNAYVTGYTANPPPNPGDRDVFLSKFNSGGEELWKTEIASSSDDYSWSVAVDASGNAYISGWTRGDLGGPNAGRADAYLSKFDSDGNGLWTTQIGTTESDSALSVAVDASGNVYISGVTSGDLGGPNAGGKDAFLVKYAAPTPLRSVSAVDIAAGFVPGGGAHGLGELTAVGAADVVVEDVDDLQTTYAGGSFEMTASLLADNSAGGLAAGRFSGGALVFRDSGGADLLTGDLIELLLYEVGDDMGMIAGSGLFEVTGGSLQAAFLQTRGEIFQMFFQVTPRNIDNFSAAFTGFTDITITPVPEPATIGMFTLGGLAVLRRRKQYQSLGEEAKSSDKEF